MSSPPLTPIRHYMASTETSPAQRQPLGHRRTSSSYSITNRSPTTPRSTYSDHRLSSASRFSNGLHDLATPLEGHGPGLNGGGLGGGNLADELEFASEDEDEDVEWDESGFDEGASVMDPPRETKDIRNAAHERSMDSDLDQHERSLQPAAQTDGARDSGVDVAYRTPISPLNHTPLSQPPSKPLLHRNFSRPMSRDSEVDSSTELFTPEMEEVMAAISRLADYPAQPQSATIINAVSTLQSLTPQTGLESQTQRLTTSTNSLTSHLAQQTRLVASLYSALFPPIGLATPLDLATIEELIPEIDQVLHGLPNPDARTLQGLSKLDRETADLLHTLAGLTDSLQMGKQATTSAARHLRNTLTMVTQLRREGDMAEQAKWKLEKEGWDRRLAERWCARECSDVVGGFETVCDGLRQSLENSIAA